MINFSPNKIFFEKEQKNVTNKGFDLSKEEKKRKNRERFREHPLDDVTQIWRFFDLPLPN